ncbi:MAG: alpha/beta hydrolase [Pyrinomonadaceae bacterium]|nr:alpha/beta hydrolase [Sphingobacteriaceae bacterium]
MIRLILLILLLLFALLTIFKAPTYHAWLAAIVATEFCMVFVILTGLLLLSGFWVTKHQVAATVTGVVAFLLFLSPLVRAAIISNNLGKNLSLSFGGNAETSSAFSFWSLISRANTKTVIPQKLTYISYQDKKLGLDFYPSQLSGPRPCVIVVHGGSWKSGDNTQLPELNSYLASEGYHVAAINYRLAPQYQSPYPVEDIKSAFSYLKLKSIELQIDTSQLVLLGRSAGAQIALVAAYTLKEPGLKGVIDFYGPADMVWGYSIPSNPLIMDSRKVMEDYLGGPYKAVPQNYEQSSAILHVSKNSVPTLIIHGENDVLVAYEHSRRLRKKLAENGIPNYFLSLPWATHGFDFNINGPGGQLSTFAVKQFLKQVTK